MGDYTPLYWSIGIILTIGVLLPVVVMGFGVVEEIELTNPLISPLVDFVQNGVNFLGYNIDFFEIFGDNFRNFIIDYLTAFGLIPLGIFIPLMIIVFTGFVYSIVKLLPTT